jgi:hypothetical protein
MKHVIPLKKCRPPSEEERCDGTAHVRHGEIKKRISRRQFLFTKRLKDSQSAFAGIRGHLTPFETL